MTRFDWDRLERLLEQAMALPSEEREGFLTDACWGNEALKSEIASLLEHAESGQDFLASHPGEETSASPPPPGIEPPALVGPYRLLEKLGEGGMGEVWLGEQIDPVERRVAVKIIKVGMDTRGVLARFQSERQALAVMDHPGIVRLLDAGSTAAGRPYFVMDVIRGQPITAYADERRLSVRDRVRLIIDACRAIEHAHQRDVIHRDIKPSNLLVTLDDGIASVKVIDFGIAKVISPPGEETSHLTRTGQLLGTPDYASPEQIGGAEAPVDGRTDVFSLGVVLYELLTGTGPWAPGTARFAVSPRRPKTGPPPMPSMQFTRSDTQVTLAAARSSTPRGLRRALEGDLDHVALRTLETDPQRRYASAGELAADLERYLEGEPVLARPSGLAYRLRRLTRGWRRPTVLAAAALVAVLLAQTVRSVGPAASPGVDGEVRPLAVSGEPATPFGPITAPAALVVNMDERHVSVVDLEAYREVGAIPAGEDPQDIVITPDGRSAYVTDRGSDRILAIDLRSGSSTWMQSPGLSPQGIDITPDGTKLYVANMSDDDVRVVHLRPDGYDLGVRIPVGREPFRVRVSPDGARVFVPNRRSDDLSIISVETSTEIDRIGGLRYPYDVAVGPDGRTAYVSANAAGQLAIVDLTRGVVVEHIDVGPSPEGVRVSPDGRYVFVANQGSFSVSVIDAATRELVRDIPVGAVPQHVFFTPDGSLAFVPNAESGDLSVIDVAKLEVIRSVDLAQGIVSLGLLVGRDAPEPTSPEENR